MVNYTNLTFHYCEFAESHNSVYSITRNIDIFKKKSMKRIIKIHMRPLKYDRLYNRD